MHAWRWALGLLFLLAAAFGTWPVQQATAQEQAVIPLTGVAGTTFAFYAYGFESNAQVVFWANGPDGTTYGADAYRVRANEEGRADWKWIAPPTAAPGFWSMVAQQLNKPEYTRIIGFEVVPIETVETRAPDDLDAPNSSTRNVLPAVGAQGTVFSFYAQGFKHKERVGFWMIDPNGKIYSNDAEYAARASSTGRADWLWGSPLDAAPGVWRSIAQGAESGTERIIFFEIVPPTEVPADPDSPPDRGVEPEVAEENDTFAFFATGYAPNEEVTFWAIAPDGDTISQDGYRKDANDDGRVDFFWKAPRHALPGQWKMIVFGTQSEITKVIFFKIR
jgi:hypothetical protein